MSTSKEWELIWEAGPYYERVAQALESAHSYGIFVGWQLDSRLELTTSRKETFRQFIVRLCREKPDFHAYFLMWDYAYFYAFEREIMQGWIWDHIHERVHFVFDNRHPYGASHHEKCVLIDGEVAFVGGVDICDDRWDTPSHLYQDPRRSLRHDAEEHYPYHDISVEVRGEIAADLVEYIGERWRALTTVPFPERPRLALAEGRGPYRLLISRTKAAVDLQRPLVVRETEFLYRELIRKTRRELVIENQYYWSSQMNEELIALMRERRGTGLRVFLVLPAGSHGSLAFRLMGIRQSELIKRLQVVARETGTNLVLGCPYVRSPRADAGVERPIYVHSKVICVDDRYLAVGSANFNNRGFRLDTELTLTLAAESSEQRNDIQSMVQQIVAHWGPEAYESFYEKRPELTRTNVQPYVYLKNYEESWRGYLSSLEARLGRGLPLDRMFDPNVPFAYFLKWRMSLATSGRVRRILPLITMGALGLSWGLALFMLGEIRTDATWTDAVYLLLLSLSWLVPIPVSLVSVVAGVHLGSTKGAAVVFCGLVVAGLLGYGFGRLFPRFAYVLLNINAANRAIGRMGLRRLSVLVRTMLSPRLGFRIKTAYQGILTIPVRWFGITGAILILSYVGLAYVAGLLNLSGS